jgi:nucleotidyltransferase/DNA polymerase involved in DNA repair
MSKLFALVDCNNFYASCERLFDPKLIGKPVVVLSNNDGCIIARSNEAKALGISMGAPYFKCEKLLNARGVEVFPFHKGSSLMAALDTVNAKWGRCTIQHAAAGFDKPWKNRQQKKSPAYTTSWQELPVVKASWPAL